MKIHPIILVVYLEPSAGVNSYTRTRNTKSPSIEENENNNNDDLYKIETLLNKRILRGIT